MDVKPLPYRMMPVDKLLPYARNARTHSSEQVAQIAASISEFGFINPVVVDDKGTIIAGHGRVLAAKELNLKEVPTLAAGHLSAVQRRAYILADNKLALNAGWDDDLLKVELTDLQDAGFDLDLTGFSDVDLAGLFAEPEEPETKEKDLNYVIQFNIVFDDEEQQEDWYSFVRFLKGKLPDADTLGQRLQIFIRENKYVAD